METGIKEFLIAIGKMSLKAKLWFLVYCMIIFAIGYY